MKNHLLLCHVLPVFFLAGCAGSTNQLEYHSQRSHAEQDADEAYIAQTENTARRHRAEDEMSDAQAVEVATRHAPTHVTNTSTTIVPVFW